MRLDRALDRFDGDLARRNCSPRSPRDYFWHLRRLVGLRSQRRLAQAVDRAHKQGRRLRFWNTPDLPVVWRFLIENGVDLIGADDLDELQQFLTAAPRSGERSTAAARTAALRR